MRFPRFLILPLLLLSAVALAGCPEKGPGDGTGADTSQTVVPQNKPAGNDLPVWSYKVVNTFPHDPGAFTEGLLFYDGALFESTGMFNTSSVRKVEIASGNILRKIDLPGQYFGEGLALFGGRLHNLTWQNNVGFVFDLNSFQKVDSFTYYGEGWGLTTDGKELIMSDGTSFLRFLDPATHKVNRTLSVTAAGRPVENINELEWVNGEIYANIWKSERLARIDPGTGNVHGWIELKGLLPSADRTGREDVLNGIAYDSTGNRLFVTGKYWTKLFEIKVGDDSTAAPALK